ncbi:EGF-like domain protein (macronuclear) [Tetrahymena thermophila SB210]|uniref:EGF-like domain protein n=1 Tax=Tetrahymena thermophila (strain SB210) TaxID=312017 RepID=Q22W77_TETTS|nr:EGF-like domain protein [Tetrahymena thermophila SB210]EAR89540.2 EGF-like domain protein [Tetrahymena thermophila SB210]|eukprot:XP_001009785.2 EGF-like domain protein [Tetrahymena thermophila SB210]
MFSVYIDKIPTTADLIQPLTSKINEVNGITAADSHDQYMAAINKILNLGALLVGNILQRKSGKSGITVNNLISNDNCNLLIDLVQTPKTYTQDLVIYYVIDPSLYTYSSYFNGQLGTGQEYMQAVTCAYSQSDSGFDLNRPQVGIIFFSYANVFGPNFLNGGSIFNIDSYTKLAAKAILQIMGLNLNSTQYWLDNTGTAYQSNPIQQVLVSSDGITHYSIKTPSLLAYANSYFKPKTPATFLLLGTYTHPDLQYVTMEMHLAPEDLLSEFNQLSFFYVVSGFTLAAITDMGWYQVNQNVQQPLTFASSVSTDFLSDVQSLNVNIIQKYPSLFALTTPSPDQCYFAYGKLEVVNSRSTVYLPQNLLLYKQLCQRSDGIIGSQYSVYQPSSGCFISTFPSASQKQICLPRSCTSSNLLISVIVQEVTPTCSTAGQVVTGIKPISSMSQTYDLTCPNNFNLFCTSEMPCQNNCTQNGICIHNFCQCQPTYIGLYCQKSCGPQQWYDANNNACVDQCPSGYYGNISQNRQCILCKTQNCLDDCPEGQYRIPGQTQCLQCPYQCQACTSANFCTKCKFGYVLNNNDNLCYCQIGTYDPKTKTCISCNSNQYFDINSSSCQPCDPSCKTCQNTSTQCTSCNTPKVFYQFTCLDQCPPGYYSDPLKMCQQCSSNCKTCNSTSTTCTSCYDTFQLQPDNSCACVNQVYDPSTNKCISCAPNQVYDPINKICQNCNPSCSTCKDASNLNTCTSCPTGKVLYNGNCQDSCPQSYFADANKVCQPCNPICKNCQTSNTNCIDCNDGLQLSGTTCVCKVGFYSSNLNQCVVCNTNQVPDIPNQQCKNCDVNCNTCQDSNNISICTSCKAPKALYQSYCYDPCPTGYYADTNQVCQPCNPSCLKCLTNKDNCTDCPSTFQLSSGSCICPSNTVYDSGSKTCKSCQLNQVIDTINKICVNCDPSCRTCKDKDNLQACTSCNTGFVLYNSTCIDKCPDKTYKDSNNVCKPCDPICATCFNTSNQCTSCNSPLTLNGSSCQCSSGFYNSQTNKCVACTVHEVPDNIRQQCVTCDPNCLSCQDVNNLAVCTSCQNPYSLYQSKCQNPCPNKYYSDQNQICQPCSTNCLTCRNNSNYCTACPDNTFTLSQDNKCVCLNSVYDSLNNTCVQCTFKQIFDQTNNKCVDCSPSCLTCQDLNHLNICTSCPAGKILYNQTCIDKCPDQTYLSNNKCLPCSLNCKTCEVQDTQCTSCNSPLQVIGKSCQCSQGNYNPNSNTCIVCSQSQVYDSVHYQCVNCNPTCLTCQDKDNTNKCTSCKNPLVLSNGSCVAQCPDHQYTDPNQVCQNCDPNCLSCQTSSTNCQSCNPTFTLQINKCVCLNSVYDPQTKTCKTCASNQIYDPSNQSCVNCNPSCLTCQGLGSQLNTCLSCQTPLILYNSQCLSSCPSQMYYDSVSKTCQQCNPSCLQCQGTSTACTSCIPPLVAQGGTCVCGNGLYMKDGKCYDSCPPGTFRNNDKMTCDTCDISCLNCRSSGSGSCINCAPGYQLNQSGLCILICPASQYADSGNIKCIPCPPFCAACTNPLNCTSCLPPMLFFNSQCIPSCPPGFSNHFGICIPNGSCDNSCIKCDQKGNCIQCPDGQYIQGKVCVSDCSSGYYKIPVAGLCNPCFKGCDKCTGPNQVDCTNYVPPTKNQNSSFTCHQSCLSCSGPGFDQCITCNQNRQLNPFYGKQIGSCVCISNTVDYFQPPCKFEKEPSLIESTAISSAVLNAVAAAAYSSPAAFLFLIDAQQTLSYFRYLNMNKPLNFDQQIKPLYYSHMIPFFPNVSKDWLPSVVTPSNSKNNVSNTRNLQNTSQQNIKTDNQYSLSQGNNRISDNQKYPFFLINAFVIIIFQAVFWLICWVMSLVVKYKVLTPLGTKIINIFRYNAIIVVIYVTMSELSLLTFYHFTIASWQTNLEILSSLLSIASLLYMIGIITLLINITIKQREQNINEEKFYILFGILNEKYSINKYYPIILIMRKIIASAIYAFAYPYQEAQGILMIFLYLPFWAFMISKNPFANNYARISSVITESCMLFCHLYFVTLSVSYSINDLIGITDVLLILIITTLIISSVLGSLAIICSIYIKIKNYKQRHYQIAKIHPYQGVKSTQRDMASQKKQDNQSKISYKEDDQLSDLSITQQHATQTPLKTNQDQSNMTVLNNSHSIQLQSQQDMSLSYNNKLINTSQNQQFNTRQFDIIDEQSNDGDDLSSAQRYQIQHEEKPKSHSQDNDEQLEFSFRSKLEGIKEQENEEGSLQFSDAASMAQRKKFVN